MSLEEMDSGASAYMKEDLLKRKFIATWQELCGLVGISPEIEISSEELSSGYTKTPYPEINRRVTRLLRCNEFPDHYDIIELIERCNTKHELGISVEEKAQLSREVFKDVGKALKAQRARDFKAHFGSHLTDDALKKSEDPAVSDTALLDKLKQSLKEGQEKLEHLCEGFVLKQDLEGEQEKSQSGEASESEEEEEEEEGDREEIDVGEEGVEEMEGEDEDDALLGGAVEDDKGIDTLGETYSIGSVSDDDVDKDPDDGETEKADSRSSGKSTPLESVSSHTSPSPSSSTSPVEKGNYSASPQPAVQLTDEEEPPHPKKIKLLHSNPNSDQQTRTKKSQPTPLPTKPTTTTSTVILLDDDERDSDVIILSD